MIKEEQPDAVILATGATPYHPEMEGADEAHVVDAWSVISGKANVGSRVTIADWRCDWIGLGLAEKLVRDGCHVRLAVNGMTPGETIPQYARDKWLGTLHKLKVEIVPYARLFGVDSDTAYFQHTLSGEPIILGDTNTLVTALGHQPDTSLQTTLSTMGTEFYTIGDCLSARSVEEAVLEGLRAGCAVV